MCAFPAFSRTPLLLSKRTMHAGFGRTGVVRSERIRVQDTEKWMKHEFALVCLMKVEIQLFNSDLHAHTSLAREATHVEVAPSAADRRESATH